MTGQNIFQSGGYGAGDVHKSVLYEYFIIFYIALLLFMNKKPNINIKPDQVIKIQLQGLMKNDSPYRDKGIEQTWEFAHPSNQRFTGPLSRLRK